VDPGHLPGDVGIVGGARRGIVARLEHDQTRPPGRIGRGL